MSTNDVCDGASASGQQTSHRPYNIQTADRMFTIGKKAMFMHKVIMPDYKTRIGVSLQNDV
ncbi:hypothetical protein GCM10007171_01950 [Dickeya fangzhongdai]|nr:hypothetical protein GCM10007171_01950 [Dickeya fangzhongdai]